MQWWMENLPHMFNVIHHKIPSVCIYSDASSLAWGSSLGEQETGGHWNDSEINYRISTKEILAVYFSLKSFASKFKSGSVKLCIDNTTIAAAIHHIGTSHSDIINRYTNIYGNGVYKEIFGLYLVMFVVKTIFPMHHPGNYTLMVNGC